MLEIPNFNKNIYTKLNAKNIYLVYKHPQDAEAAIDGLITLVQTLEPRDKAAAIVVALFQVLKVFLYASSRNPPFAEWRSIKCDKESVLEILNAAAIALSHAQQRHAHQRRETIGYQLLDDAIQFCALSIMFRLQELKSHNDKFFEVYDNSSNKLKNLLTASS